MYPPALPGDGKSHHVAGVFSGGTLKIYVDKVLVQSKATSIAPGLTPGGAGRVTLGANDIGGFWFDGTLDRVRISRQGLSPSEFFPSQGEPSSPLVIVEGLHDLVVAPGGTARFHVVTAGGTNLTYRWTFNGQTLSNQISDTVTLENVRASDAGTYRVTVQSGPWEVSSSGTLTVTGTVGNAPVIVVEPQSRLTGVGFSAQFAVTATSDLPLSYQWFFNSGPILGETNATMWVVGTAPEDAGTYHVVVSNSAGSVTSRGVVLHVFSSTVIGGEVYLDNHTVGVDAPVTDDFGVRLTGPGFVAQLYAAPNGQALRPVGGTVPFGAGEMAGYFSDPFARVIPGTAPGGLAHMEVRVWDARTGRTFEDAVDNGGLFGVSNLMLDTLGGGTLPPATLTSLRPFSLASQPRILEQPVNLSIKAGETATFRVVATGSNPLSYQWRFNDTILSNQTTSTLVLSNVTELHAGGYSVEVRNSAGTATSTAAQLTLVPRDTQSPVVTLTSPQSGTTTQPRVTLSGSVTDNSSVVRAEWSRNNHLVGPVTLTSNSFSVTDVLLLPGTNNLTVRAYDADGNAGSATVSVVLDAQRLLWIGSTERIQEGLPISVPVLVSSRGDIGALSLNISYDTNYLAQAGLFWSYNEAGAFE